MTLYFIDQCSNHQAMARAHVLISCVDNGYYIGQYRFRRTHVCITTYEVVLKIRKNKMEFDQAAGSALSNTLTTSNTYQFKPRLIQIN